MVVPTIWHHSPPRCLAAPVLIGARGEMGLAEYSGWQRVPEAKYLTADRPAAAFPREVDPLQSPTGLNPSLRRGNTFRHKKTRPATDDMRCGITEEAPC
jgi:hypothetical protein